MIEPILRARLFAFVPVLAFAKRHANMRRYSVEGQYGNGFSDCMLRHKLAVAFADAHRGELERYICLPEGQRVESLFK